MQYVLVTGASSGMGRAVSKELVKAGYKVFALDRVRAEEDNGIIPVVADVTNNQSLRDAMNFVASFTDSLHAIIHFAGMYMLDSLVEISEEAFTKIFDINVFGVYRVNKEFLPLLHNGSRIIITTSELAPLDPLPFTGLYAITKSTLDKYAYSLRMELQLLGIRVSVLRPGAVRTGMLRVSTDSLDRFCEQSKLYSCNALRFKRIVDGVEARNVSPERVAKRVRKIVMARKPGLVYKINRNPLLLLLNILPARLQTWIIKLILS